jgi:Fe-S cluster assembly ATP-binding protein
VENAAKVTLQKTKEGKKMPTLEIKDLHASVENKKILKGVNLTLHTGEIHSIMGPNGSGKSTLSFVLMGHPKYKVEKGTILLDGENLLELSPDERARKGMFLGFQYPAEVQGVSMTNFLLTAYRSIHFPESKKQAPGKYGFLQKDPLNILQFRKKLLQELKRLRFDESFASRSLNEGFSGGEKKRNEILQMAVLKPTFAVLDEIDSGLDIDALKIVAKGIKEECSSKRGFLIITHYQRILHHIKPDFVHVMIDGKIAKSGNASLAENLEEQGYGWLMKKTKNNEGEK